VSFRPRTFRFYLTVALAVTALVPLVILALLQREQLNEVIAQSDARQLELAQLLADDVAVSVSTSRKLVELAALRLDADPRPSKAELDELLAGTARLFPGFMSLHFSDAKGRTLAFFPEKNWRGESNVGVDHADRWHFVEIQRQGGSVISPVFKAVGATERQIVSVASPARDAQGRFLGYAAAGLDLGHMAHLVHERVKGSKMGALIADEAGNAIYHPSLDLEAAPKRVIPPEILARLEREGALLAERDAPGEVASLAAYVRLPELGWVVGLTQPIADRNAVLDVSAATSLALLLAVALLTLVVGAVAARPLASAVRRLMAQVDELAQGRGESNAERVKGPLELVRLQDGLLEMAHAVRRSQDELHALNQELERQVVERTATLRRRNQELRSLHGLLVPMTGVNAAVEAALSDYARLLELDSVEFSHQAGTGVPVSLKGREFGLLRTTPDLPAQDERRDSLARLADSLAVVLGNEALYSELGRQHATLTAVFESMSEGLILFDAEGGLLYANRLARELIGSASRAGGEARAALEVAFASKAGAHPDLARLGAVATRLECRHHPGRVVDALGFEVQRGDAARGLLLRDVTREVQVERLKESLISVVAHELKTPIAAMRIQVETLARSDAEWTPEFRGGLLEEMLAESRQLERLIDDWLDVTRIEGGILGLDRKVVQIASLLDRACRVVQSQYAIEVSRRIARNAECCNVDPGRVTQLLINLLSNAARYSQGPAKAHVEVRREGRWIEIRVRDQGIGIAADQLERIFDRFYQVDMSMTRRAGGTGLGLAICRGIAEAHGGSIVVESELDVGSCFIVRLPY